MGIEEEDNWKTQATLGNFAAALPVNQGRTKAGRQADEAPLCTWGKAKQRPGDEGLSLVMQGSAAKANSTVAFPFCRPTHC